MTSLTCHVFNSQFFDETWLAAWAEFNRERTTNDFGYPSTLRSLSTDGQARSRSDNEPYQSNRRQPPKQSNREPYSHEQAKQAANFTTLDGENKIIANTPIKLLVQ